MSWDIYIQDLPAVASVKDIPDGFRPRPIGGRDQLLAAILQAVPFAEQQDKDWLFIRTDAIDLSVNLGMEVGSDEVGFIALHVHGGDRAPACVAAIVKATGLRALDTGTGEFFDPEAPAHGHGTWAAYREEVVRARS